MTDQWSTFINLQPFLSILTWSWRKSRRLWRTWSSGAPAGSNRFRWPFDPLLGGPIECTRRIRRGATKLWAGNHQLRGCDVWDVGHLELRCGGKPGGVGTLWKPRALVLTEREKDRTAVGYLFPPSHKLITQESFADVLLLLLVALRLALVSAMEFILHVSDFG